MEKKWNMKEGKVCRGFGLASKDVEDSQPVGELFMR